MKVFLTGGTGFIGQALVRDPQGAPARWMATQGARLAAGDVTRREGLREAMAGADVVMHNAGVYELGANEALRERMQRVNVQGTDNVLGAALEAGVPRTVYVSTALALGPSGHPPEPAVS